MKTLFCVIGNLRAGQAPIDSFKLNFKDNVDLLLCIGNTYKESEWRKLAKYIYEIDESDNEIWEKIYDSISLNWRSFNHFDNTWGPYKNLSGSGMIICSFRQKLYEFITSNNLKYDRYVLTRSDHIYTSNELHNIEDQNDIYIPEGEEYGGVTDRFCIAGHETFLKSLKIINYIQNNFKDNYNIETYLHDFYKSLNLNIKKIKRTCYTVARKNEQTRWMKASQEADLYNLDKNNYEPYFLKYPNEYNLSI